MLQRQQAQLNSKKRKSFLKKHLAQNSAQLDKVCTIINNTSYKEKPQIEQFINSSKSYMKQGYVGFTNKNYIKIHEKQSLYNPRPTKTGMENRQINRIKDKIHVCIDTIQDINNSIKEFPKYQQVSKIVQYFNKEKGNLDPKEVQFTHADIKQCLNKFSNCIKQYYDSSERDQIEFLTQSTFNYFRKKLQQMSQANYMFNVNQVPQIYEDITYLNSIDLDDANIDKFQLENLVVQSLYLDQDIENMVETVAKHFRRMFRKQSTSSQNSKIFLT